MYLPIEFEVGGLLQMGFSFLKEVLGWQFPFDLNIHTFFADGCCNFRLHGYIYSIHAERNMKVFGKAIKLWWKIKKKHFVKFSAVVLIIFVCLKCVPNKLWLHLLCYIKLFVIISERIVVWQELYINHQKCSHGCKSL